jgi:NADH-quinone oxidoreductase subunit D
MPKFMLNKNQNLDQIETLNYNRDGTLLDFIDSFVERFPQNVDEYENLLTENRIWKQRTVGIGVVVT